ncbi:hypothetical protein T492DRAFT_832598 [Pavlovales sp. CCMP2436]|nr:hypothetical protein T492DRAFT_832598 [Pavlovales sp. CCMP2436]
MVRNSEPNLPTLQNEEIFKMREAGCGKCKPGDQQKISEGLAGSLELNNALERVQERESENADTKRLKEIDKVLVDVREVLVDACEVLVALALFGKQPQQQLQKQIEQLLLQPPQLSPPRLFSRVCRSSLSHLRVCLLYLKPLAHAHCANSEPLALATCTQHEQHTHQEFTVQIIELQAGAKAWRGTVRAVTEYQSWVEMYPISNDGVQQEKRMRRK